MKVVISGGTGFLGLRLAMRLAERDALRAATGREESIGSIVLFDAAEPAALPRELEGRVELVIGDVSDPAVVRRAIDEPGCSVFHLASVVSAGAERDFELAMRVNLDGARHVLDACRTQGGARLVTTSSYAAYGGKLPDVVTDSTPLRPQSTYGMTKAMLELLVNDYSRRRFLDGRTARLPTVIVRPGTPNLAASSWVSGVFREPLGGIDFTLPVGPAMATPVAGVRTVVESLAWLHDLDADALGPDRALLFPSVAATASDMVECVRRVGSGRPLGAIEVRRDPAIEAICGSWPKRADAARALRLGIPADASLETIAREYLEDYLSP